MSRLSNHLVMILLAVSFAAGAAMAADRPRIGLVLGGGGARGAAHIGVLELLEELRVPVDCVSGTSMGALVAGTYAAGLTPAEMRQRLGEADWKDMFNDLPAFEEINLRRKEILRNFIPGSETGVKDDGLSYQTGVVDGQKIKLFFNRLVGASRGERYIDKLPLPLSIIATDIGTGERVVYREGSLTSAMRASMSVPGLLSPVVIDGRKLVDGGLVDNVPIGEVRERCQADIVIAVNVGSPMMKAEDVGSLLTVSAQMVNILTEQNVARSLATLKPDDIYIKPDLGTITAGDFGRNAEAADRGRAAAETVRDRLARLGTTPERYAAWRDTLNGSKRPRPVVDEIDIAGLKEVNPAAVERHLHVKPGDTLYSEKLGDDLNRIYGDGYYQSVDYKVLNERERNILRITPVEKPWGPDYLRFGINLEADTSNSSSFLLRIGYHKTLVNRLGGELLATVDIGTDYGALLDYYQPLDPKQRVFAETFVSYRNQTNNIYQDNKRLAQYDSGTTSGALWLGANLGVAGQVRVGWLEQQRDFKRDIGNPLLPDFKVNYGGWNVRLDLDQLNRLYFPTDGWSARLNYFDSSEAGFARIDAETLGAFSIGRTVFNARASYAGGVDGSLPFYDAAKVGGPLNLSAYARGQITGDDIAYLGIRAERIIGQFPLGFRGDLRLGAAIEGAHVGRFYTETNLAGRDYLDSGALYLASETPIGPFFLGYGRSSEGSWNVFFTLGVR
ncbi:MAG: patatin [Betaproteobacteria bacterium]|nr:patatin [Betaproteobacteria bacterium]